MRIGVFGGTFDPPHIAHLILADECRHQLELDRVLWVLTQTPPHKLGQVISPLEQRLSLLQAALAGEGAFQISRADIDRPAPHYAVDTLRILRAENPTDSLVYLMGGDSLRDLPTWHTPREFAAACDEIGVMRRPGALVDLDQVLRSIPELNEKLRWVETPLIEISASDLRRSIREGAPYRHYLPPAVAGLIATRGWYRD